MLITSGWIFHCIIFSKALRKSRLHARGMLDAEQGQAHVRQGTGDHNQLTSLALLWPPAALWAVFGVVTSKPRGTPGIYKARINTPLLSDLGSFWSLSGFVGGTWLFCIPRVAEAFSISVGFMLGSHSCWIQVVWIQKAQMFDVTPIPCRMNISRDVWVGGVEWPDAL